MQPFGTLVLVKERCLCVLDLGYVPEKEPTFLPWFSAELRQTDLGVTHPQSKRGRTSAPLTSRPWVAVLMLAVISLLYMAGQAEVSAQAFYGVTVEVTGFPSTLTTAIFLDGVYNGTIQGGAARTYNFSAIPPVTHTVTVDFYVPGSQGRNGTRYVNRVNTWSFTGPGYHEFEYSAQYFLTVQSDYGTVSGQAWYDSGETAYAAVSVGEISAGLGTRHFFAGWGGDATGTGLRSNEIVMNGPKKAIANWKTQYLLTITVSPPSLVQPNGAGWKDAGTTATFSVVDMLGSGVGTRFVFDYWSGDYAGQSSAGSILMDGPKSVVANYKAQYQLTIRYSPQSLGETMNLTGAGWHDALSTVALGPAPTQLEISQVERLILDGWIDNGSQLGQRTTIEVFMDEPHTIDLIYHRQFLIRVQSEYGQVHGGGWYDEGSVATFGVGDVPSEWMVQRVFKGWNVQPQTTIETAGQNEWQIRVDRPYVLEAVWEQNFNPLIAVVGGVGAVGALIAVGAVVALRYNRGLGLLRSPLGRRRRGEPPPLVPSGFKSCVSCAARIPAAAAFCHFCGRNQETRTAPRESRIQPAAGAVDDRVFDYIVAHEGVISLSKAAQDLGINLDELKAATERLKKSGRLG
jgi:hypothetical protein